MKKVVRAVVVTMFQSPGDKLGELSFFREHFRLKKIVLPETGLTELYWSDKDQLLAIVAGVGTANTAVSILSLLRATEFCFKESLWLIFGVAGGNPHHCSLGSVVLCDFCVDADLAFEVDAREIPPEWETGIFPLGASEPYGKSAMDPALFGSPYQSFALPQKIFEEIYEQIQHIDLTNDHSIDELNAQYKDFPSSQEDPMILRGGCLSGARFWHGAIMNEWAEKWFDHFSNGRSRFIASAMEDTGTLLALKQAAKWDEVDEKKIILVRAISNYTMPPKGGDPIENLVGNGQDSGHYPSFKMALENGFIASKAIIDQFADCS